MDSRLPVPMIGYWRVSMVAREEIISDALQRREGEAWAARSGRRIIRWIGDPDKTGRNFDRRVAEAIAAIEAGEAAEIGVLKYDRWGRDALESLVNVKRVKSAGGDVVSFTEPFDSDTAIGEFSRLLAFGMAQLQSQQIGEGWQRAHASRTSRGLTADGGARFGYVRLGRVPDEGRKHAYRRDPDDPAGERYVPDPVTGPVLAAMYERFIAGEGPRSLARWLNAEGVITASGAAWTRDSVRLVLASGFGAGLLWVHDPACRRRPERGKPCKQRIHVPGAHRPVIGGELWQAYLDRAAERSGTPPRLRDAVHPLSGLLYCGTTDHRLTVTKDAAGLAYRCPRRTENRDCGGAFIRATVAEAAVLKWLAPLAGEIEAQARAQQRRAQAGRKAQSDVTRWAGEEKRHKAALARLLARQALDEDSPADAYDDARRDLTRRLEAARARLAEARAAESRNTAPFLPVAAGLLAEWRTLSPGSRREMLKALIARVEVHKTGLRQPPVIKIIPVWEDGA
jgi:DNA invertase Pin-like site-specific DNA recombinase